jgi:hypothetical protein
MDAEKLAVQNDEAGRVPTAFDQILIDNAREVLRAAAQGIREALRRADEKLEPPDESDDASGS